MSGPSNCREECDVLKCHRCGATGVAMETEVKGVLNRFAVFACGTETVERFEAEAWNDAGTIRGPKCLATVGDEMVIRWDRLDAPESWKR